MFHGVNILIKLTEIRLVIKTEYKTCLLSTHLNIPTIKYVGIRIENKNVLKNTTKLNKYKQPRTLKIEMQNSTTLIFYYCCLLFFV